MDNEVEINMDKETKSINVIEKPNSKTSNASFTGKRYTFTLATNAEAAFQIIKLSMENEARHKEHWDQLTDTLKLEINKLDDLKISITDPETGQEIPINNNAKRFSWECHTKFSVQPEGVRYTIAGQNFFFVPGDPGQWEEWYTPDKTLDDLMADQEEKPPEVAAPAIKRTRPGDAIKIPPITGPLSIPRDYHYLLIQKDAMTSSPDRWKRQLTSALDGYYLHTDHGGVSLPNITDYQALKSFISRLGPKCLQYTMAATAVIKKYVRENYKPLPESEDDIKSICIVASDLLREMGQRKHGNGYSRKQQIDVWSKLLAQTQLIYANVTNMKQLSLGPMIKVEKALIEGVLPLEGIEPTGNMVAIYLRPGEVLFGDIKSGIQWFHRSLLALDAEKKQIPEFLAGVYINSIQLVRRDDKKQGQEWLLLESIEQEAGMSDSNLARRMDRLTEICNHHARTGLIPGERNPVTKEFEAIYKEDSTAPTLDKVNSTRLRRVKIQHSESMENGYEPIFNNSKKLP